MYRIILTDGTDIAVVDEVNYIRFNNCGTFCPAESEEDAIGVAVNGVPFNLKGHEEIEDADTVLVSFVDGGLFAKQTAQNTAWLDYLSAMTGIDLPNEDEDEENEPENAEEEGE